MRKLRVKGYKLIELLGRGAGSEVYKARQLSSGDLVALKVIRRSGAPSARFFKQIANEFRVARDWSHPNLVELYELLNGRFLIWRLQTALAMEYVPGETLDCHDELTGARMVDYYRQVAAGMKYMHDRGYVHLDMKPQNIIVTDDGIAKIMDFGLCIPRGTRNPRVQGTPAFMSPEQVRKGKVDERTDIYNLKGFCHFKLKQHEQAIEAFTRVLELNPGSAIDYANIGSNYREMEEKDKAIYFYEIALSIDPSIDFARESLEKLKKNQN